MENRHEIKTVEDIVRVVNENNIDDFLKDFEGFLKLNLLTKAIADSTGGIAQTTFVWIDDGRHNVKVILNEHNDLLA